MYLKVNSNKFVGKFKIIDSVISNTDKIQNSNINTPFNILAKQDNIFIPSNLDINTNPQLSVIVNKKSILSYQSDLFLRKKLNNFLPLYIYYIQMIYIHNYKYKN